MGEGVLTAPMGPVQISPGEAGRLIVRFPYSPKCVAKIKTVAGRRWHPEEKYWTLPCTDGVIAQLLALFAGGRSTWSLHFDP